MNSLKHMTIVLLLVVLTACVAQANVAVWETATANWNAAANWDEYTLDAFDTLIPTGGHVVPGTADTARVWSGQVQVSSTLTSILGLLTTDGDVSVSAGLLTVNGAGGPEGYENVDIGRGGVSTLTVANGGVTCSGSRFNVGKAVDDINMAIGTVEQTGGTVAASIISIGEIAYDDVRDNGYDIDNAPEPWPWDFKSQGFYNLSGGTLDASGGSISVGKGTEGTLNLSGSGAVDCDTLLISTQLSSGSEGYVNQTGGSIVADSYVNVGRNAYGEFNLQAGTVDTPYVYVGDGVGAEGVVNQTGGTVTATQCRLSSNGGQGTYNFDKGIMNLSSHFYAGLKGPGVMNMGYAADANSVLTCDRVYVGQAGGSDGEFNLADGSTVNSNLLLLADAAGSQGVLNVEGGSFTASNEAYAAKSGSAEINVSGGSVNVNYLRMGWNAGSEGNLTISGGVWTSGYITGNQGVANVTFYGSGASSIQLTSGRLNFRDQPQNSVTFVLDAGGITPVQTLADHITLDGNTAPYEDNAPTINIDVTDDFSGNIGDTFDVAIAADPYTVSVKGATLVNLDPRYTFAMSDVALPGGGEAIRMTIVDKIDDCQGMIDAGLVMTGDISGPEGVSDCVIDLFDLGALAGNWLICNDPQDPACN